MLESWEQTGPPAERSEDALGETTVYALYRMEGCCTDGIVVRFVVDPDKRGQDVLEYRCIPRRYRTRL